MKFHQKRFLVVGGSSGIGLAAATLAMEEGAEVSIASRSADKLLSAAARLGGKVKTLSIDVTEDELVERALSAEASFDHVVVTASDSISQPVRQASVADAQALMNSKFWGFYRIARAVKIKPGGSIGVVSGFRSKRPGPDLAVMSAVNAALEGLVRGMALDFRPVRVNAVSPALVETPLWDRMEPQARKAMIERLAALYPAGVVGQPEDIANMLLALAANPFATGTVVTLDGGASLV